MPSALYTMRPTHQQSLKLLCPTVKEEMHLQEFTSFDVDLSRLKVTQNVALYPPHHVTYAPAKYEAATFNGLLKKIHLWSQDYTKRCPVPSQSCDLYTCKK